MANKKTIGKIWKGQKYIHGPRVHSPGMFSTFRLSKPTKKGVRFVFGKSKRTGEWLIQSKLTPIKKYEDN